MPPVPERGHSDFFRHKKPRSRRGFLKLILQSDFSASRQAHSKQADAQKCKDAGFGNRNRGYELRVVKRPSVTGPSEFGHRDDVRAAAEECARKVEGVGDDLL